MLRLSKVLIHLKMKMLRLSNVLIHLKMKMLRPGKAKDVFIHFGPLVQASGVLAAPLLFFIQVTGKSAPLVAVIALEPGVCGWAHLEGWCLPASGPAHHCVVQAGRLFYWSVLRAAAMRIKLPETELSRSTPCILFTAMDPASRANIAQCLEKSISPERATQKQGTALRRAHLAGLRSGHPLVLT
jgi:hypothetical protein